MTYLDTSFLFSLYVRQDHSEKAAAWMERVSSPPWLTTLGVFEFQQAVRMREYLFKQDRTRGIPAHAGQAAINQFQAHLKHGVFTLCPYDWEEVTEIANRLSTEYTRTAGYRTMDIFHVATALQLGAREFLTFDASQRELARCEGLKVAVN